MKNIIALYPWGDTFLGDKVFEMKNIYNILPPDYSDLRMNYVSKLRDIFRENDTDIVTIDMLDDLSKAEWIIFFNAPRSDNKYYRECIDKNLTDKMVLFMWEPEVVMTDNNNKEIHDKFKIIFTWNDSLVDNTKFFKFNYPEPELIDNEYEKKFEEKKFCTLIAGNKKSNIKDELYSERINTINYLSKNHPNDFEFYGRGWRPTGNIIRRILKGKNYSTYKGETDNKLRTLSDYKYCICYENQKNVKGYITEKIFDCFFSRVVPVYWGAENIDKYIPSECYIDRRNFRSNEELYNFMIDIDETMYNKYIVEIKKYLNSDKFVPFTEEAFVEDIKKVLIKKEYF